MSNSVSYNYQPNESVYVINTLGPNNQYPYWGYPYIGGYGWAAPGPVGYPGAYPNGFTSNTPAIQSGVVLQTRILFTNPTLPPSIMYDVRITNELGSTPFPENMVFPATPGVAGYQTVDYAGTLTLNTVMSLPSNTYSDTIYIDGVPVNVAVNLSTVLTVAAFISVMNTTLNGKAVVSLVAGNLVVTSGSVGSSSSIVIVEGTLPIFASVPNFVRIDQAVAGVASGLDLAQAYYATLNL